MSARAHHSLLLAPTGDPLKANVAALLRFNGTHGSTTFSDETGRAWTGNNATVDTSITLVDAGAGKFNGPSSPSDISTSRTGLAVGSGDFCIETGVRPTAMPSSGRIAAILSTGKLSAPDYYGIRFFYEPDGKLSAYLSTTSNGTAVDITLQSGAGLMAVATLSRVCLERAGGTVRLMHEGSVVASAAISGSVYSPGSGSVYVGAAVDRSGTTSEQARLEGRLDEFRWTIGAHRYAGAYTPIIGPFPY